MANEKEMQEKAMQIRYMESQANLIQQQMLSAEELLISITTAINTVKESKNAKDQILVPFGAGIFAFSSGINSEKFLVDIGAGIVIEKTADEAIEILETRKKATQDTVGGFASMLEQIKRSYTEAVEQINHLRG